MGATREIDLAVVGAGPYGVSLGAAGAGRRTVVFGRPFETWERMPRDMQLRAAPHEMSLSAGAAGGGLDHWRRSTGTAPEDPLRVESFVRYGSWFVDRFVPELDPHEVLAVSEERSGRLLVETSAGSHLARAVVVSVGITPFPHAPAELEALVDGERIAFAAEPLSRPLAPGERVAIVGGGQTAVEAAARAAAAGAEPTLLTRNRVHWFANREPSLPRGPVGRWIYHRLYPAVGYGPPPLNRLVLEPDVFAALPRRLSRALAARLLRPGASPWLRDAVDAGVEVREGVTVHSVEPGRELRLRLSDGGAVDADRLLLGTGYRFRLDRLPFLGPDLRSRIRVEDGWPVLDRWFRTSDRRISFVGYAAEGRFGPIARFVLGVPFTVARVADSCGSIAR